jgi:HEAT repeat protein
MKQNFFKILLSALIVCSGMVTAQNPANRAVSTIVADVLAQLPADRQSAYDALMKELGAAGTEGVKILTGMMNPPGQGDNAAVEYALNGLADYASGDEALRGKVEQAFLEAIDATEERETKAFLIRCLAMAGSEASIRKLAVYLTDDALSSPSAYTIASIGGEAAGKALQMALLKRDARSPETQYNIIQALGEVLPTEETESLLLAMLPTDDVKTKALVLKTLSKIGSKASLPELAASAAAVEYKYELTGAADAYVRLIKRVYEQGDTKEAALAVQNLLKNATKAGATHVRIAALEIIFLTQADKLKTLKTALKDSDKSCRNAALGYASCFADKVMYTELFKMLPKAGNEVKTDILNRIVIEAQDPAKREMLKTIETGIEKTGTQTLIQQLDNADFEVRQAAATALAGIGNTEAIPALAGLLKSEDVRTVALAKNVLSSFSGDIVPALVRMMNAASDEGKKAALELLALRKANAYFNAALEQTNSPSQEVKTTAYNVLKDVVSEKDLVVLCGLLETSEPSYVKPLQQAVISVVSSLSPAARTETVTRRMIQAGDSKRYLYYPVLSSAGDKDALDIIVRGYKDDGGPAKDAAFDALLEWKGFEVEEALYDICKNSFDVSYAERALDSYISLASDRKMTGENRLIFLRKAMEAARTDEQKNRILKNIGQTGTFLAIIYAGTFLDDQALKENAAQAVMNIALANKSFNGKEVEDLLRKAASSLNNPDADYQRQAIRKHLDEISVVAVLNGKEPLLYDIVQSAEGFVAIFNGKDLTGWKGLVADPVQRAKMKPAALKSAQAKADEVMRSGWSAVDGELVFNGKGDNICTERLYGDFEMYVDWKLDPAGPEADAGIYLRGTPQVQIWDTSRVNVGAQVGSGGLYNNVVNQSKPLKVADNRLGEWNTFYIKMTGDRVTVKLNGELVVDNVIMENFWDPSQPVPFLEQIELQAHGSKVYYRNIYVKERKRPEPYQLSAEEKKEGFQILFDGTNMHEWTGNLVDYKPEDGCISISADTKFGGNLYTKKEYANFIYRFEFQLTPAANNGVGIRTPTEGDAAYVGMEVQILDSEHPVYKDLAVYQYHGSIYGIIPAKRGFLRPAGEWNTQEIMADGTHIRVTLNGTVILDGDIAEATKNGTADKKEHPGLFNKSGHIGFLGHGSALKFRNIRIRELK